MLLRIACLLGVCGAALGWVNDYDNPAHFECPQGLMLTRITSRHNNRKEDRVWDFGCSKLPLEGTPTNCEWTNYVNEYDQPLTYQCRREGFLTGMVSVHNNHKEDRRFKFKCCELQGAVLHACYFTNWENEFDHLLDYVVPANKVLRGVVSYHDNRKEDRRFNFEICDMDFLTE